MCKKAKIRLYIILFGVISLAMHSFAFAGDIQVPQYYAVVDAGSAGSRLHFYEMNYENGLLKIREIKLSNNEIEPGLYTFAKVPGKIEDYFKPLIESLKTGMKDNKLKAEQISFYVFSTAGMRIASPMDREKLYSSLKSYISKENFRSVDVDMIKGNYEGIFDWLTVNYIMNTFTEGTPSKGVLDMGGGSTQIAFETPKDGFDIHKVQVGSKSYNVYSKSYLGLGMDYARYQFSNTPACWPKGYPLPSDGCRGEANFNEGVKDFSILIDFIHKVNITIMPEVPDNMEFIGVSGFYYISVAKAVAMGESFSIDEMQKTGLELSKQTWDELKEKYPNDSYLYSYLLDLELYTALLKYGYNFKSDREIRVIDKVNGISADWTLGAAIYLFQGNLMK